MFVKGNSLILSNRVTVSQSPITLLQWNNKGNKLLIGDKSGNISVWAINEYLINIWESVYSHSYSGDQILGAVWFNQGNRLTINYDKIDSNVVYQEKFDYNKVQPSVVQFGNKHTDGFLCITSSAIVHAHLWLPDGSSLSSSEILGSCRKSIFSVDIAYMKNGDFIVITSDGYSTSPLICYTISIDIDRQQLNLACKFFIGFTLNSAYDSKNNNVYQSITHLRFAVKEDPSAVLVGASNRNGSIVELWELKEKTVQLHSCVTKAFPEIANDQSVKLPIWKLNTSFESTSHITCICTPFASLFDSATPLSSIVVSYKDNTIKCFCCENMQSIVNIDMTYLLSQSQCNSTSDFYKLYGHQNMINGTMSIRSLIDLSKLFTIQNMQLSWSSCALIVIDSLSQLHVFRMSPVVEPGTPMSLNYAQLMLEYSLLSGNDNWDILISLKPSFVETICDRIHDNFVTKQQQSIQQKWYDNVLQLKTTLHRCVHSGSNNSFKAGDYHTVKMLNAISETIKRLIRTSREYQDKDGPSEKLHNLIHKKPADTSMNDVLLKLENKDFFIEHPVHQSFQNLLQWVCDLCLYLLASVPQQFPLNKYRLPGVSQTNVVFHCYLIRSNFVRSVSFWMFNL